jgi:micrococcal nuclease
MRWYFTVLVTLSLFGCETRTPQSKALPTAADAPVLEAEQVTGRVMNVIDGDTLVVLNQIGKSMTIQLKGVDAPELPQAFGKSAREKLQDRVGGKLVRVVFAEADEFGRRTAEVFENDQSVNVWLIRAGLGWHNWKFDPHKSKAAAEKYAREKRIGLWAAEDPVPPWEWKNPPDDGKLYVQGNGSRYHRASCRTLDRRRQQITLEDALKTHSPCRVCNPPTEME